jgi:hypothetical protein
VIRIAFHFHHAARDERHGDGHALRDVVQPDDDRHDEDRCPKNPVPISAVPA